MNTAKLKTFARKARTLLRAGVAQKVAFWGFAPNGTVTAEPEAIAGGYIFRERIGDDAQLPDRWQKLRTAIRAHGVEEVIERAAYTWFNRLIALKILEQNGFEQPQLEFTEPTTGQPRLLQRARQGQTAFLTARERQRLQPLLADYAQETAAFGLLLVGFCHQPDHVLNRVFGHIDDYTELLLPDDLLAPGGFLDLLNTTEAITADDYKQVELIGWLYQFYISEKKDEVFSKFKKSQKAEAADIPAATQIFTPNWIVKYLVENTLGRTWLDHHPASALADSMRYYVAPSLTTAPILEPGVIDSTSPSPSFKERGPGGEVIEVIPLFDKPVAQSTPFDGDVTQLTCLDPAVGSGHMLVEAFDLLMRVYQEEYYLAGEAVRSILQHNLFGLDLDERAAQLARFALLMKAAHYDATILSENLLPRVYAMPEATGFSRADLLLFLGLDGREHEPALADALNLMQQAQNLGSLMRFGLSADARAYLLARWQTLETQPFRTLADELVLTNLRPFLAVLELLTQQYACLTANPPYMGAGNMNNPLKLYVNQHYARAKSDLFAVFMDVCENHCLPSGRWGMINQQTWMFTSSYELFRTHVLEHQILESMLHLGIKVFEELNSKKVQSTAFIFQNSTSNIHSKGTYFRLVNHSSNSKKEKAFLDRKNQFLQLQNEFYRIPGFPLAYWASSNSMKCSELAKPLHMYSKALKGFDVGSKTDDYMKLWHEVSLDDISGHKEDYKTDLKWVEVNRGGIYRKWYGNRNDIVKFGKEGELLYNLKGATIRNKDMYFKNGITFSVITSGAISFRASYNTSVFYQHGGTCVFQEAKIRNYFLGLLNSKVNGSFMDILCPTLSFSVGDVSNSPIFFSNNSSINQLVDYCLSISKQDWDSRETSWDFVKNPLIVQEQPTLEAAYHNWETAVTQDFYQLHQNEEELNRLFIDLYGLQDELTPEIPLKDITILQEELDRSKLTAPGEALPIKRDMVMQQFISYAIGCLMGRYRLDQPGLHIAHPNATSDELSANALIDADGIIPLMGTRSAFADDAVGRVREFIQLVWGDDALTRNLNFLQAALDRDLDTYLVRDFWGHHVRRYQKKPIYWLFSSPKGAFQVLVYMHRMNKFTAEKIRTNYLLRHLQHLQRSITELSAVNTLNKADTKQLDQLRRDLLECETYDLLLKDIADRQIDFDLDDGVTRNLALFKGVVAEVR